MLSQIFSIISLENIEKILILLFFNMISRLAIRIVLANEPSLITFWDIIAAAWSQAVTTLLEVSTLICSMILSSLSAVSLIFPKYMLINRSWLFLQEPFNG